MQNLLNLVFSKCRPFINWNSTQTRLTGIKQKLQLHELHYKTEVGSGASEEKVSYCLRVESVVESL